MMKNRLATLSIQVVSPCLSDSSGSELECDSACEKYTPRTPTTPTNMAKFRFEKYVTNESFLQCMERQEVIKSPTFGALLSPANLDPIEEENNTDGDIEFDYHSDFDGEENLHNQPPGEQKRRIFIRNSLAMRTHSGRMHLFAGRGHKEIEEERFKFRSNLRDCRKKASVSCIVEAS
eukprot:comp15792_c0_seq1/m.13048 comp15792_c0_seq1/g.13048  ORF comp15792_c0_seq1/g.13048 comp15792_c0_seq1/m.13048 type:complete len:177 (-) comp15792_c0_seq1:402-932(-)